jgi:hypothetical protein
VIQTFTGVTSGSFAAPDHPYPSFLTISLTATDSGGLTGIDSVDLQPKTSVVTIESVPNGLQVEAGVEGLEPFPAPHNITAIEGGSLSLNAPSPQTVTGNTYTFSSWSNGQPQSHTITVPVENLTLEAIYETVPGPFTLTVATAGTGSGQVKSAPAGIRCGTDCTEAYDSGTVVNLTPKPVTGSTFAGWSGSCTGTGPCAVTMDAAKSATATFNSGAGAAVID